MITLLTGINGYSLLEKKKNYIGLFAHKYGNMSIETLDSDSSLDSARSAILNVPFLVEKKLVIIDEPSRNKELIDFLLVWLKDMDSSTEALIIEPDIDKRTSWYKFLFQNSKVVQCSVLSEYQIRKWIEEYVELNHGSITTKALSLITNRVGLDQYQLSNELNKLLSYSKNINEQNVELLVDPIPQDTIFSLLESLARGNLIKTMEICNSLRKAGVDNNEILAMIGWQLHTLLLVKSSHSSPGGDIGLHPFVIEKNQALAKSVSMNKIKTILTKIADAELLIKRDGLQPSHVVDVLIHDIIAELNSDKSA